jgi:hypothetical protein
MMKFRFLFCLEPCLVNKVAKMLSIYSAPGNEHEAVVEFAPYQKVVVPKEGRRRDPKLNTLDQDPDYLKFLEFLAAGPEVGYKDVTQRLIRSYGYGTGLSPAPQHEI